MSFYSARSFQDKVETCRSLARHTTDERTLRVLQSLIEEYMAAAAIERDRAVITHAEVMIHNVGSVMSPKPAI